MKLSEYLDEAEISTNKFREILADENINISHVGVWKWLRGLSVPKGRHMAVIQKLTKDKVQAVDWLDG